MNSLEKRRAAQLMTGRLESMLEQHNKVTRQMADDHLKKVLAEPVEDNRRPFNYAGVPASPIRRKR
jgi:hypothetical protein